MSLLTALLLLGTLFGLVGLMLALNHSLIASLLRGFPRSRTATVLLFGGAALWFLYRVWNLSEADFGNYRQLLFVLFLLLTLLSFVYVPDFLAVRGFAGLILLGADPFLSASFMRYDLSALLLSGAVYLGIFAALWLGAQPYRMRDFIEWLQIRRQRSLTAGGLFLALGATLALASLGA